MLALLRLEIYSNLILLEFSNLIELSYLSEADLILQNVQ